MLVEPKAEKLVSHAFFMNVPFRGAPKTFTVIATGRDPLDGGSMIDFVDPLSLRAMALTAPIVYHLSPSAYYRSDVPIFTYDGPDAPKEPLIGLDAERAWVNLAIETGFMPSRKVVPASAPLGPEQRRAIALRADAWNAYWEDHTEHERSHQLARWSFPGEPDGWAAKELARRGLADLDALRVEQGWSERLAERAKEFHKLCEKWARATKLVDRCFIFYSAHVDDKTPTTVSTDARLLSWQECSVGELTEALHIPMRRLMNRDSIPPPRERANSEKVPSKGKEVVFEEGVWRVERWYQAARGRIGRQVWRFATVRQDAGGDGTVPLPSLIGFGGRARVFKRLEFADAQGAGPDHLVATKSPDAWRRIVMVVQGHDVTPELARDEDVDPVNGIDHDPRLKDLQDRGRHRA